MPVAVELTHDERGLMRDALLTAVYKRLNAENIVIPFPQRDVHLKGTETSA